MRRATLQGSVISGLALGIALLSLSGCRNPFVPASEVSLVRLTALETVLGRTEYVPEVEVQFQSTTLDKTDLQGWMVYAHFLVSNRVGVNLSRVNIVYTNVLGQEITQYRTSGGKSYKIMARLEPVSSQTVPYAREGYARGIVSIIPISVVDNLVFSELSLSNVIFAHVTFWGEDDNGYDVKLSSQITIKGYNF